MRSRTAALRASVRSVGRYATKRSEPQFTSLSRYKQPVGSLLGRRGWSAVGAAALGLSLFAGTAAAKPYPDTPRYSVGIAKRSINPDPDGTWRGEPVNLGGYGL